MQAITFLNNPDAFHRMVIDDDQLQLGVLLGLEILQQPNDAGAAMVLG